jgi:hypothetical protein
VTTLALFRGKTNAEKQQKLLLIPTVGYFIGLLNFGLA